MSNRSLAILVLLFFVGLAALWPRPDRDPAEGPLVVVPPSPLLLPALPATVDRLEIDGDPAGGIVLRRVTAWRWERLGSTRGLASALRIEDLLERLRQVRPARESGPLDGPAARYGLDPPRRVLRVYEGERVVAVLKLGASVAGTVYARAGEGPILAVDGGFVNLLDQPESYWNEDYLVPISSWMNVRSMTIRHEGRTLRMERNASRGWRFVEPTKAPIDTRTVLSTIARLAIEEVGEPVGAAEAEAEAAAGLDSPWLQVTLVTDRRGEFGFSAGGKVAGRPGWYAIRREGDPEIVAVSAESLDAIPKAPEAYRSRRAMVFRPDRVRALAVLEGGRDHLLIREGQNTWRLERPDRAPADAKVVDELLKTLSELDTLAIFSPEAMPDSGVESPEAVVKLWLGEPGEGMIPKVGDPGDRSLSLGRRDAGRKQVYAQTGEDTLILALLDTFPAAIPRGDLAFRDRAVQAIKLGTIARIAVEQPGRRVLVVSGGEPGDYSSWRMEEPVGAKVDAKAVATLDLLLSRLRAASLVDTGGAPADPARFGLDNPVARVSWTSRPEGTRSQGDQGTLRIGAAVSESDDRRYASLDGRPGVFTLEPRALAILTAELHERTVLSYPPAEVARVSMRWPGRPAWVIERRSRPFAGVDWVTVSGDAPRGLPMADIAPMAARLALLTTDRFAQYDGPHPPEFGLDAPALAVEVSLSEGLGSRLLRIGATVPGPGKSRYAAAGSGKSGPVFLVPEEPWAPWLNPPDARGNSPAPPSELPDRVFVPSG